MVLNNMDLRKTNEVLESLVEGMLDPDENDLDAHGMDAATQKRLKVKKMHKPKGVKKLRRPTNTHAPFKMR